MSSVQVCVHMCAMSCAPVYTATQTCVDLQARVSKY